jgi:hypothetical protein
MRKKGFYGIIIGLLIVFWSPTAIAKGPSMVLKDHFFDAQEVKEGDIIKHTFHVCNKGDKTLRIKAVTSD